MKREWRSQSWITTHPVPFREKLINSVRKMATPIRRLLGKITLHEPTRYVEMAARWLAWHGIEGDYCEFGVYTGRQFVLAYKAISRYSEHCRFYAFDSFEGLPEPKDLDMAIPQFAEGGLAATREEFVGNLEKNQVDLNRVKIVPGWYSEILRAQLANKIGLAKVAIVLIDCDLYASTVPVLDFLTDLLSDGSVIIFDDWYLFQGHPDLGAQRAFREWKDANPSFRFSPFPRVSNSFQNAFILHKPLEQLNNWQPQ